MTCPHCFTSLEPGATACPQCGVRVTRNVTAVMRTSAVWISAGEASRFYGSLHDVPQALRERLVECTNGVNSGTIVIADRGGRDRLLANAQATDAARKSLRGTQYARSPRFSRNPRPRTAPTGVQPELPIVEPVAHLETVPQESRARWVAWAGVALAFASAAVIAFAFGLHW